MGKIVSFKANDTKFRIRDSWQAGREEHFVSEHVRLPTVVCGVT
jgi:hypothetical protein